MDTVHILSSGSMLRERYISLNIISRLIKESKTSLKRKLINRTRISLRLTYSQVLSRATILLGPGTSS
jgi:hypothetical protein